jgi:hypothetical protein
MEADDGSNVGISDSVLQAGLIRRILSAVD